MASNTDDPFLTGSSLTSLIPAVRALCDLLTVSKVPGALIGGVAASLHGQARATEDVDALLRLDERTLEQFLPLAIAQGFRPRIPDAIAFARRSAVLLLEHEASRVGVDLTISRLPFDSEAIEPLQTVAVRFRISPSRISKIQNAIEEAPPSQQQARVFAKCKVKN